MHACVHSRTYEQYDQLCCVRLARRPCIKARLYVHVLPDVGKSARGMSDFISGGQAGTYPIRQRNDKLSSITWIDPAVTVVVI